MVSTESHTLELLSWAHVEGCGCDVHVLLSPCPQRCHPASTVYGNGAHTLLCTYRSWWETHVSSAASSGHKDNCSALIVTTKSNCIRTAGWSHLTAQSAANLQHALHQIGRNTKRRGAINIRNTDRKKMSFINIMKYYNMFKQYCIFFFIELFYWRCFYSTVIINRREHTWKPLCTLLCDVRCSVCVQCHTLCIELTLRVANVTKKVTHLFELQVFFKCAF